MNWFQHTEVGDISSFLSGKYVTKIVSSLKSLALALTYSRRPSAEDFCGNIMTTQDNINHFVFCCVFLRDSSIKCYQSTTTTNKNQLTGNAMCCTGNQLINQQPVYCVGTSSDVVYARTCLIKHTAASLDAQPGK